MRHHKYNPSFKFIKKPVEFNKYTDRSYFCYCLGATMYMPGTKDFTKKLLSKAMPGLTSMVLCLKMPVLKRMYRQQKKHIKTASYRKYRLGTWRDNI